MIDVNQLKVQYVTNEAGEKTAVILSIEEFEELIEDIADLAAVAERRDDPTVAHEEVIAGLKRDGLIIRSNGSARPLKSCGSSRRTPSRESRRPSGI